MTDEKTWRTLIDAATLGSHLDDPNLVVVDCRFDLADTGRGERDYAVSHVPGAFYAHLDRDLSSPITPDSGRHPLPDINRLVDLFGRLGIRSETQVIAYDDSGGTMAVRLWWLLRWLGHDRVAVLDGGWPQWVAGSHPQQTTANEPAASTRFSGEPDRSQVVTTDAIARQLETGANAIQLMDARTGERYRGEQEPIDPVAGHIPGAFNLPLTGNLGADGRFLPADELRARYLEAIGDRKPQSVAAMCGSGVTACHNLLAMEIAGLPGGRLYAGSWSEWIRDAKRPVATSER
ncbi:MAG: sulfurtransferase [Gammaproteobacteria bacterium]|nr:sulfurtransferase [Gammaproteobacteria bacterium]